MKRIIWLIAVLVCVGYIVSFNYGGCGGGAGGTTGSSNTPAVDLPPVLNAISDQTVSEGATLTITVSGTDPEGGALTYTTYNMPAGAIFTAATRTFTWTPNYNQAGTYPGVRFRVIDSAYLYDEKIITITATDVAGPNAPSNLSAQAISSSQIELTWTDNSNDEDGFRIERKIGATGVYATLSGTVAANVFTYSDYAAFTNSPYYYRVRSYAAPGNSAYSNEVSAAVIALNIQPTVINNYVTSYNHNSATLYGVVNPNGLATTGYFQWGATASYGATTTSQPLGNGTSSTGATTDISGLSPSTTYHFRVVAANSSGTSSGADATFTTSVLPVPPTATTTATVNVIYNSITLTGIANPNGSSTNVYFQYGISATYGSTTQFQAIGSGTSDVAITATLTSIFANTLYHYRLVAENNGGTAFGADQTFTTPAGPPTALTNPATNIDFSSVTFNGTVNPNALATSIYFQWGATTSYGNTTLTKSIGSGTGYVNVAENITGLTTNNTYYFRLLASNSSGTVYGLNQSFTCITNVRWTQIIGGEFHTVGVKNDGTLWTWGNNANGELGLSNYVSQTSPTQVGTAVNWKEAAVGSGYTIAIKTTGTLWSWGDNSEGQLGLGSTITSTNVPTQVGTETYWASIAAGGHSSALGVTTSGNLLAWGDNSDGQLGTGDTTNKYTPTTIISDNSVESVAAGCNHTVVVKTNGSLYGCGDNTYGQLGTGDLISKTSLTLISNTGFSGATVGCGLGHTVINKLDGMLLGCGSNAFGQLGLGGSVITQTQPAIITSAGCAGIAVGANHTIIKENDGTIYSTGDNGQGQLGLGDLVTRTSFSRIVTDTDWSIIATGWNHSIGIKNNGTLLGWGDNNGGQLGVGDTNNRNTPFPVVGGGWAQVDCGNYHTIALKGDSRLWVWGGNYYGQLGVGNSTMLETLPVQTGTSNWKQIICGSESNMAIKTDGTLWAWGWNYYGQLGLGDTTNRNLPVQVGTGTNWKQVEGWWSHTLAIKTDGTLWAWGNNGNGQLGLGDTTNRNSPVQVGIATDWKEVGGCNSTLAIKTDGTLWAWGYNAEGQLGLGDTTQRNSPVQVGTETNWKQVTCAAATMAIKTDGTLWVWGRNGYGQLGLGVFVSYITSPTQLGNESWQQIECADSSALGIKTDGSLWSWGANTWGQLGLGDTTNRNSPVRVGTGANWKQVACGGNHTLATQTNGTLWAWGYNQYYGQLGLGDRNNRYTPTQVLGQ